MRPEIGDGDEEPDPESRGDRKPVGGCGKSLYTEKRKFYKWFIQ